MDPKAFPHAPGNEGWLGGETAVENGILPCWDKDESAIPSEPLEINNTTCSLVYVYVFIMCLSFLDHLFICLSQSLVQYIF